MNRPEHLPVPELRVTLTVWQKMMAYIINCPTEVNGFGIIDQLTPEALVLSDVFITEQVAGPAHVNVDPMVLSAMMTDMLARGEDPGKVKFQWHSHVDFNAYFSGTDTANIDRWPGDWLISVVANKQGEYSCRLDVFKGVRLGVELKPTIVANIDDGLMRYTALDISQKVRGPDGLIRRGKPVSNGIPSAGRSLDVGDPQEDVIVSGRAQL